MSEFAPRARVPGPGPGMVDLDALDVPAHSVTLGHIALVGLSDSKILIPSHLICTYHCKSGTHIRYVLGMCS